MSASSRGGGNSLLVVYALTTLLSAALLFLVQPMIGKLLLPQLGGGPSVWNTCMVFFQAGLLAGYVYAHVLARTLRPATQVVVHCVVLAISLLVLPIGLRGVGVVPEAGGPILWLFAALAASVGLPFFVISTTGPLLQHWLATTDHPRAQDPYFLYAASNLGSLSGLLAYPLLLEPLLRGTTPGASLIPPRLLPLSQTVLWSIGYIAFAALVAICGVTMVRRERPTQGGPTATDMRAAPRSPVARATRLRWVLLAFVPSSLLLGVTLHLTTDVAAIPLFWVVPLAVYLLTFIIAFSPRVRIPMRSTSLAFAIVAVLAAASLWAYGVFPLWAKLLVHLLALFTAGLLCHGRLAAERPSPDRLTEFYFLVALGGVLGGMFNALVAPFVFDMVAEYPIALVLACLLRPEWNSEPRSAGSRVLDYVIPAGIVLLSLALTKILEGLALSTSVFVGLQVGILGLLCLGLVRWRLRFALALAVVLAIASYRTNTVASAILRERTFFGVSRVVQGTMPPVTLVDERGQEHLVSTSFNVLLHGTTKHGSQNLTPSLKDLPTCYYHRGGPMGQVFASFQPLGRLSHVGFIGLGAGTLATYGQPGDRFTFYEIDPAVVRIARDTGLFTFLTDSKADVRYVVGDGRRSLTRADDGEYGMIVLDAFSSDSVPVHLLTREAFELYFRKLQPDGLLAVNISNNSLFLDDVVFAVSADLGLAAVVRYDATIGPEELLEGKEPALWAVVARSRDALGALAVDPRWSSQPIGRPPSPRGLQLWTDDYSNVLGVLSFR